MTNECAIVKFPAIFYYTNNTCIFHLAYNLNNREIYKL